MATLTEIATLLNDPALTEKVRAAVIVAAVAVAYEAADTPNHVNRLAWSKAALADPVGTATKVQKYILGAMQASSLSEIQNASDATLQGHVNASLAVFAV